MQDRRIHRAISRHMRHSVLGFVAIFIALTMGTAYATHPGGANTISSEDIIDAEIRTWDIRDNHVRTPNLQNGAVNRDKLAKGAVVREKINNGAINADKLAYGAVTIPKLAFEPWALEGNAGTDPATDFLGTTDDAPLELRVDGARALRLEPASDSTNVSPNVIGGIDDNAAAEGVHGATIAGGSRAEPGDPDTANQVTDDFGTIGGGVGNQAGDDNESTTNRRFSTVGGGFNNTAEGARATIGGGAVNAASGDAAAVAGGTSNQASAARGTVAGGFGNVAGGSSYSTVDGGRENTASGTAANVGGGWFNTASGQTSNVAGGDGNTASGGGSVVAGGVSNTASAFRSTVLGGLSNTASGAVSTVVAGSNNTATGEAATIAGGSGNTAAGDLSLVAGKQAKNTNPDHDGVFLFADAIHVDFPSAAANEFAARASGGFRFRTSSDLATGCNLPASSGTFACTSDVRTKRDFESVAPRQVLGRLVELPIRTWRFAGEDRSVRHLGPTSQDFHRAFGLGPDRTSIGLPDANGVALAAIKGLNDKLRRQQAVIASHERRLDRLERMLARKRP